VPYTASNIIDLLKRIKKDPVVFPHKVHPQVEDVIRRMLVVDPAKRIEWADLFRHPATRLLEDSLEQNLRASLLCKKEELPFNMSKFYIKTNRVVADVH
jgi:serine/threonine protein kinase